MLRTAAFLLLLPAGGAFAAGDAPLGDSLVEPRYRLTVIEAEVIRPLWAEPDDARSWAILRAWAAGPDAVTQKPPPPPIPLPPGLPLFATALAALFITRRKPKCA